MRQDNERRKHVRRAVLLPCRVEGTTHGGTMRVTDLSAGGCFVATSAVVSTGSHVTLHTKVEGSDVLLAGRVIHVQEGRGFAIEFLNLAEETRQRLEHLLVDAGLIGTTD